MEFDPKKRFQWKINVSCMYKFNVFDITRKIQSKYIITCII